MAFIGNSNTTQGFTPAIDYFNGNGSTTAFTLSRPVASVAQVQVVIENVPQNPGSAYTVSGNTITFTSAPPSGTSNIYVYYTSPITQVIAPGQGTVNTTALGNITNIASGNSSLTLQTGTTPTTAMTINTSQNVGIGTSSPQSLLDLTGNDPTLRFTDNGGSPTATFSIRSADASFRVRDVTNSLDRLSIDTSGNFQFNSGYGSVATAYGCRAWVNFNGTGTVAIRASGNVSSITDNGTGDYTVNFTTAMPDANYSWSYGSQYSNSGAAARQNIFPMMNDGANLVQTTSIRFYTGTTGAYYDSAIITLSIFR